MKQVFYTERSNYGNVAMYPTCRLVYDLCRQLNCKTITPQVINVLKVFGYEIAKANDLPIFKA